MKKGYLSISNKINIVLGFTILEIFLVVFFSIIFLEKNKSFVDNLANNVNPSNISATNLYAAVLNSKSLIKNWVFVDLKSNTPEKKKLETLHYHSLPTLTDELINNTSDWNKEERALIYNVAQSILDSLTPMHLSIMNSLDDFDDYSNPMIMMEIMTLVEEEDDSVMALSNRILSQIENILEINRIKILRSNEDIQKSSNLFKYIFIFVGTILILGSLYAAYYLSKILTTPIKKLIKATRTISQGDLSVKVNLKTKDDMQELGDNFNLMTEALAINEKNLIESNRTKDKFFEIIAHDLRSPFNSFVSVTEVLKNNYNGLDDERKKSFINNIYNSSLIINTLIENLLDWAKSQSDQIAFTPKPTNLTLLTNHTIALLQTQAIQKNITVIQNFNKSIIAEIDVNSIRTVLRNLISNAIKFSPNNSVVEVKIKELDNEMIEVNVIDNGIGLSEEDIDKLFRIDVNTKYIGNTFDKGSGLGLILCKEFVEMHNGEIFVKSIINKGSTFTFTIPKKQLENG